MPKTSRGRRHLFCVLHSVAFWRTSIAIPSAGTSAHMTCIAEGVKSELDFGDFFRWYTLDRLESVNGSTGECHDRTHPQLVPEGIVKARAAFLRDFPALMADRKTRGKYVCYHNDKLVAIDKNYRKLVQKMYSRGIPDTASLIVEVSAESERIEQVFAVEGELN